MDPLNGSVTVELESPDEASEEQQNYRAGSGDTYRAEIKTSRRNAPPAEEPRAKPTTDERADDSEKDRDDTAGRVPPWHQELRQCSGDEAKEYPVKPERQTLFPA